MVRKLTVDPDLMQRVQRAIDEVRAGRMVIIVDDEDRENEGDLMLAADAVTPEAINFMATHGRGLICLALEDEQIERLRLPMMTSPGHAGPPLGTAFTVSIEARHGVTTGISAADRAHTMQVAIRPDARPEDLVTPGHVFPLRARKGGVLVRTGQTEGSVDLARLAGRTPAGVICEIMNADGTMARMPDLEVFAAKHGLQILTIADLIQYRMQTECQVRPVAERQLRLDTTRSDWRAVLYESKLERQHYLALVKGEVAQQKAPVLCRVHRGSIVGDIFSSGRSEGGAGLRAAMQRIEQQGRGVVLYLPPNQDLAAEFEQLAPAPEPRRGKSFPLRDFGLGAQVLADLGLTRISILTDNPRKIAGIAGYGLEVVETIPLTQGSQGEASNEGVPHRAG